MLWGWYRLQLSCCPLSCRLHELAGGKRCHASLYIVQHLGPVIIPLLPLSYLSTPKCPKWLTRNAAARLAIHNHLPLAKCAHFGQHRTAEALYKAVVARYSSLATAALGRLLLPYLFPKMSAFATVEDLVSHLRTSDARYRATVPAEFLDRKQPPMFITLYFIVTRLPDSLRSVRDHFLSLDPTSLTVDLLEEHLLAAETSAFAVGAAHGTPRTPFFEGCSPSPLAPSYASAAVADVLGAEDVGAASASAKRRSGKGKGGRGGGGGSGGGGGGSSGGGGGSGGGGSGGNGGGSGGSGGGDGGSGGSGGSGSGGTGGSRTGAQRGGSGGGQCWNIYVRWGSVGEGHRRPRRHSLLLRTAVDDDDSLLRVQQWGGGYGGGGILEVKGVAGKDLQHQPPRTPLLLHPPGTVSSCPRALQSHAELIPRPTPHGEGGRGGEGVADVPQQQQLPPCLLLSHGCARCYGERV
ncbi:unnamed protein product [Closterium sp. NIES-54]